MEDDGKHHFSHHHILSPLGGGGGSGGEITCHACRDTAFNGHTFYGCLSCEFYLHEICMEAPRAVEHSSHPQHPLALHPIPTYFNGCYGCNACGRPGAAFSYGCAYCEFDLHLRCAVLPETMTVEEVHSHELKRVFETPLSTEEVPVACIACGGADVEERLWAYYCEECEYCMHVKCIYEALSENEDEDEDEVGAFLMVQGEMDVLVDVIATLRLQEALDDGDDEEKEEDDDN